MKASSATLRTSEADSEEKPQARPQSYVYRRHSLTLRILHWIFAGTLVILLSSGLQIFDAYPALHWGESSYTGQRPFFQILSRQRPDGTLQGITRIGAHAFDTTGFLGVSATESHGIVARAIPEWLTTPSGTGEALGRRWHFFFAWVLVLTGLAYCIHALAARRFSRELWPSRGDWRGFGTSVIDHVRLRRPRGEAARRYNVLQKLVYLLVMFVILPGMVLMGLAMSPRLDAVLPGWVDWLGGRQTARSLHFIGAMLIALFMFVHVFEVLVTGPINNLRSMVTGRYRIRQAGAPRPNKDPSIVSKPSDETFTAPKHSEKASLT